MCILFDWNVFSFQLWRGATTTTSRRRQAWAESDEDEPMYSQDDSSPRGDNSVQLQEAETGDQPNSRGDDDEDWFKLQAMARGLIPLQAWAL